MSELSGDGESRDPVETGAATSAQEWAESAITWAIVAMHKLSHTAQVDASSESDKKSALAQLEQLERSYPQPPDVDTGDEADGGASLSMVSNIVSTTLENLRVRQLVLTELKDSTAPDGQPVEPHEAIASPEPEEEMEEEGAPVEWLAFPTKRPSQMDQYNWVLSFRSEDSGFGQFKRPRQASPMDETSVEAVAVGVEEVDTAPDKGAYLVMMRKRQELADELIASEERYVEDLEAVLKNYYDGYDYGSLANVPNSLRGRKNIIFGNLKKIMEFNKALFAPALATVQKTPLKIGQTFMDYERELGHYSLYFKNMPAQEGLLEENLQFFRSIQIRLNDPFTLQSYLIKPMQRMTKYKQFLESFQNYTPKTEKMEKFHEELAGALWLVRFQLRHGNDLLVLDRLKGFDGNPAEQGLLLRQGEFQVQDKKGRHERQVFLFEDMLVLAKKQKPSKGSKHSTYAFKDGYKVCDMGLVENSEGSPCKFELFFRKHNSRESIYLTPVAAENKEPADVHGEWVADVQKLLWQQFKRVKDRMKNLRSGVESSMFGNKRASTLYGEAGYYANPADCSPMTSLPRIPSIASAGSKEGSGYAVPQARQSSRQGSVRRGVDISTPVHVTQQQQQPQQAAYAISPAVVVGSSGVKTTDLPPPTMPPPPVPSTETSASSTASAASSAAPPPVPPPPVPPPPMAPSEYLLPDEPKAPQQPLALPIATELPEPPSFAPRKPVTSPTRAPPPPPAGTAPPPPPAPSEPINEQPLPGLPDESSQEATTTSAAADAAAVDDDGEPIYDEVTDDEFDDESGDDEARMDMDPDRQSVATFYEEVDGKRVKVKRKVAKK